MDKLHMWFYILAAVFIAVIANSLSSVWASKPDKLNIWLIALVLISPFVFITFGLVTSKLGLAVSSGTIDSLLTLTSVLVGLVIFGEWSELSKYQYYGMGIAMLGIVLMQIGR